MRNGFWIGVFWNLGVFAAISDVRAVATIEDFDAVAKISDVFFSFGFGRVFSGF